MWLLPIVLTLGLVVGSLALILDPKGLVLGGLSVAAMLLWVLQAHGKAEFHMAVFALTLMSLGFLQNLAGWRTQGRPRAAWLGRFARPGRRSQIAQFVLMVGIGGYLLRQSFAEVPPFFPHHGGTCQPNDCSESSDLFCDDACGVPVCLSIPASSTQWTCCTPDAPVKVQLCAQTGPAQMCCQWLKAGAACSCHLSTPPFRANLSSP